jgi:hypothetical protein
MEPTLLFSARLTKGQPSQNGKGRLQFPAFAIKKRKA